MPEHPYVDPQKQYRRGLLSHALRGATNQNKPSPAAGMREYANRQNSGTLPWQIDKQTMDIAEEMRVPNIGAKQRSGFSTARNDYIAGIKDGSVDPSKTSLFDFQSVGARDMRSAAQKNYEQRNAIAEKYADDEAMQTKQLAIFDNYVRARQYDKFNEAPGHYNPTTGKWESAIVDDETGEVQTQAEVVETITEQKATAKGALKTSELIAKFNVEHKETLLKQVDSLDKQMLRLQKLRDKVAAGPATGRMNQYSAAWSSAQQVMEAGFLKEGWNQLMDMKDAGMSFGQLTELEFERALKTIGTIGNTREANLQTLDDRIDEMYTLYELLWKRNDDPESFFERKRTMRDRPKRSIQSRIKEATGG